jgi:hypothetical protein
MMSMPRWKSASCRVLFAFAALIAPVVAGGEPPPEPDAMLLEEAPDVVESLQALGPWEEQAQLIERAQSNVFRRYGWNSEADRFTLELIREIDRIPPWDFFGRMNKGMDALTERYELSPDQRARISEKGLIEAMGYMGRHGGAMFEVAREVLRARIEQRPFTADEVARWTRRAAPLMEDGIRVQQRMVEEIQPLLNEKQRRLLGRDMSAANRRIGDMRRQMARWERGEWRAEDWGMQDDPIQTGRAQQRQAPADADSTPSPGETFDPTRESEWERYTRLFIARYRLDEAQRTAAMAILRDVQTQLAVQVESLGQEVRRVPQDDGAGSTAGNGPEDERLRAVRVRLFEQLKRRLDRLPSAGQREMVAEPDRQAATEAG